MVETICEHGGKCIFLEKEIIIFNIPLFPKSSKTKESKELCYFCTSLKKFKRNIFAHRTKLTHAEKFNSSCKYKVNNTLMEYIENAH